MTAHEQPARPRKLGPGSDSDTLQALALVPATSFQTIVDAGCGTGRQTLALAGKLQTGVHAVDISEAHLEALVSQARESGLDHLITPCCMDMRNIPEAFPAIDLLWSECAAYSIGFDDALRRWHPCIAPGGHAVISELSWLDNDIPDVARQYLQGSYPNMRLHRDNITAIEDADYCLIDTHVLSKSAWVEDYYEVLAPHAQRLLNHPEPSVRRFAEDTLKSIAIFEYFSDIYGYVFYVLKKP